MAKGHLPLPVTAAHVLNYGQFADDHETSLRDIGLKPVLYGDQKDMTQWSQWHKHGKTQRIPHDQLRAGQMKVDTKKVVEMAQNGRNSKDPIQAVQMPNGQYMLRDGHHGVAADVLNGKTSTKVLVTHKLEWNGYSPVGHDHVTGKPHVPNWARTPDARDGS